jgi:antitoxin component of RelBE/YafQ-DinJ toxin-antitoxin module
MTLTLAIDEQLAQRARQIAEGMDMTLEQLILRYLKDLTSQSSIEEDVAEMRRLSGQGDSQGWRFNRDETHERK